MTTTDSHEHDDGGPSARDRQIYTRCVLDGERQAALATEFSISQPRISQIISECQRWHLAQFKEDVQAVKARQVAQLEATYGKAMRAWECSREGVETVTVGPAGTTTTRKGQAGDPRLLQAAMEALAAIRRIVGAEAAQRIEQHHTTPQKFLGREQMLERLLALAKEHALPDLAMQAKLKMRKLRLEKAAAAAQTVGRHHRRGGIHDMD